MSTVHLLQFYQLFKEREHTLFSFFLSPPNSRCPTIEFTELNRIKDQIQTEQIQIDLDKLFKPHHFPRTIEQFYFVANLECSGNQANPRALILPWAKCQVCSYSWSRYPILFSSFADFVSQFVWPTFIIKELADQLQNTLTLIRHAWVLGLAGCV